MKKGQNIQEFGLLMNQTMAGKVKVQTHWCKVVSVDWEKKTMTANAVQDDLPFYEIQLGLGSFYRKPKVDSICLIGIVENQDAAAFLIEAEAFEEAVWYSGNSQFFIKENGFIIKQGDETLKKVLNDWQEQFGKLCDEINKVVVSVGTSPNVPAIKAIKNKVSTEFKERLNTILIE